MKRKSSPSRIPKPRKKRSWVWNYFTESEDGKEKMAFCQVEDCKDPKIVLNFSNTTQLAKHLEFCHNIVNKDDHTVEESSVVSSEKNEALAGFTREKQEAIDCRLYAPFFIN